MLNSRVVCYKPVWLTRYLVNIMWPKYYRLWKKNMLNFNFLLNIFKPFLHISTLHYLIFFVKPSLWFFPSNFARTSPNKQNLHKIPIIIKNYQISSHILIRRNFKNHHHSPFEPNLIAQLIIALYLNVLRTMFKSKPSNRKC